MNKELLYSWMAGFVDGEGTITICAVAKHRHHVIKLGVSNTNYESIKLFTKEFGGKVRIRTRTDKKWKPCYEWSLTSNKAINAIKIIKPYLKIKHQQAKIVLKLDEIRKNTDKSYRRWDQKLKIKTYHKFNLLKENIQKLNKRGL